MSANTDALGNWQKVGDQTYCLDTRFSREGKPVLAPIFLIHEGGIERGFWRAYFQGSADKHYFYWSDGQGDDASDRARDFAMRAAEALCPLYLLTPPT